MPKIVAFELTDKEAAHFDAIASSNGTSRKFEVQKLVSSAVAKQATKRATKKIPRRR